VIDLQDLPVAVRPGERRTDGPEPQNLPDLVASIERQTIRAALERHGGVQTQAAQELGISERVLRYKLKKYGLEPRSTS
jgi:two-component system response regulator AtoC